MVDSIITDGVLFQCLQIKYSVCEKVYFWHYIENQQDFNPKVNFSFFIANYITQLYIRYSKYYITFIFICLSIYIYIIYKYIT